MAAGAVVEALAPLVGAATRVLFFTGKGGVGKTSLACATAIRLADAGRRVLLVSTDPASNLSEVLGATLSARPLDVPHVLGLQALDIDPEAAAAAYRERVVGPIRGVLPDAVVRSIEEQLSGACTVEIAAFDEFTRLLADARGSATYDHVVFDTAPTGHTLRLLALPAAWTGFIDTSTSGTSCLGPLAGLRDKVETYRRSLEALRDPSLTTLVLVARPDSSALKEAARTSAELEALGITRQHLIVNGLFLATRPDDSLAAALEARAIASLRGMPETLRALPRTDVSLQPSPLVGVAALRDTDASTAPADPASSIRVPGGTLGELVDALDAHGHGVVMAMGKGGVGKTTVAAAIAVELSARGHRVHLSTTDPAAHVAATLAGEMPGLTVARVDAAAETHAYAAEVLASAGAGLDDAGRALLEEDLRSPCTEEIAVFRAFARTVALGQRGFVVLDTAPTGHTLLLLDAAEAYHRDVQRTEGLVPDAVRTLLPRLRDGDFTHAVIVTLPEPTPVHEAAHLQEDLRRAGIEPWAWVVNQSVAAATTRDPLLLARATAEQPWLDEVAREHATRLACLPMLAEPPVGPGRLRALMHVTAMR